MKRTPRRASNVRVRVEAPGARATRCLLPFLEALLEAAAVPSGRHVEVVLAGTEAMRRLKKRHFGVDQDTDVIAFPVDFPELPASADSLLGEVWIGLPAVAENARRQRWSTSDELAFVLAHGLLHLLGWDDATEEDRARMFAEQRRLLDGLAARRGPPGDLVEPA